MTAPLRLFAVVMTLVLATATFAHQQKEAITRVLFNPRTGNIEVMHRFLLHDVEHASEALFGEPADLLRKPEDRNRFEDYVHRHFTLADQDGASISLTPVGNEIEGRFLWVYAEAAIPEALTALTISHGALHDVWSEQTNLVNVERANEVRSAIFKGGSAEMVVFAQTADSMQ